MSDLAATKIPADWINGVQADLRAVIVSAAINNPPPQRRRWLRFTRHLMKCVFRNKRRPMKKGVTR
ncbi:hypothetical protein [Burkholderia cepacia]|uniref:hypothetical protein n=1 Tax=Burkholderia cepacia TaxID=292 RepID=UPI00158CF17F|nr:hypothetical protein [Burkholderia cepacia]